MKFVQNIGSLIKEYICHSEHIDIAVALASQTATDLLENMRKGCQLRFVVGIDLPTPLEVLKNLMKKYGNNVRIYNSEMFHPKVYLFTLLDGTKKAILGSGNFTSGGLYENIEASVLIENVDIIIELENWFHAIYISSQPITEEFLINYKEYIDIEMKHHAKKKKCMIRLHPKLDVYAKIREDAIKLLRSKMKERRFIEAVNERPNVVRRLRKCIDLENHFEGFDLNAFFKIQELGNIRSSYKSCILEAKQKGKLADVLSMLIDENIPLNKRFDKALDKTSKVRGLGINFLSKVLCVYNPDQYVIWNKPAENFFNRIGLIPDKGLTHGEQYQFYCNFFREVCKNAGVPDMAALDALIWE